MFFLWASTSGSLSREEPIIISEVWLSLEPDGIQNLMNKDLLGTTTGIKHVISVKKEWEMVQYYVWVLSF